MMQLEGTWPVYRAEEVIGSCEFVPQGLYWKILCHLQGGQAGISRLALFSEDGSMSLGIPIPQGGVLTLERKLPQKSFPQSGDIFLELLPADAPLISRRKPAAFTPDNPPEEVQEEMPLPPEEMPLQTGEEPMQAEEAAPNPEETPEEPPCDMPEEVPDETPQDIPPREEPREQAPDGVEQRHSCPPSPKVIPFRPGEPLPSLKNWQQLRAVPDGEGSFLLHWEVPPT